jgi:hypothetical protein
MVSEGESSKGECLLNVLLVFCNRNSAHRFATGTQHTDFCFTICWKFCADYYALYVHPLFQSWLSKSVGEELMAATHTAIHDEGDGVILCWIWLNSHLQGIIVEYFYCRYLYLIHIFVLHLFLLVEGEVLLMFAILFSMVDLFPLALGMHTLWWQSMVKKNSFYCCTLYMFIVGRDCKLLSQLKLEDKKVKLYVNQ